MYSNTLVDNDPFSAFPPYQEVNDFPASDMGDIDSECNRILLWFDDHLLLTAHDAMHKLKIAQLDERIRTLYQWGYDIYSKGSLVDVGDGTLKETKTYFMGIKLMPGTNVELGLKYLIERVPGFEKTDIRNMPSHEKEVLYYFLKKME